jgi:sugar/nucleoside kinase (ribokinase family)
LSVKSKIQNPKSKIQNPIGPIVSIGDLVADLIVVIPRLPVEAGQHQLAQEIQLEPGGGANFLIAGARLGQPMAAIGALGADVWGYQVAALMQAEGVDLSEVQHTGATTTVVVLVSRSGEHVFLGKYGHGSKIKLSEPGVQLLKRAGAIYCAGYTLSEAHLADLTLEAMHVAKQTGIPIFFDPGPQIAEAPLALKRAVLSLADTVLATEAEVSLLTGGSVCDLMESGPRLVVVKRGPAGCAIYADGKASPIIEAPGYPVPVVDTTAAGDSFNAAFMVATLRGWPIEDCAKLANATGAAKVKKLGGGRNVPTLAETQSIINQFKIQLNSPNSLTHLTH